MARPIKETPILKGKDAQEFEKAIRDNQTRKVPREEYDRAMKAYNSIDIPK